MIQNGDISDDYGEDISLNHNEVAERFRNSNIKTYNNYLTISNVTDNKFSINAKIHQRS